MSGFRYFRDTILHRNHCHNIFDIVSKEIDIVYNAYTVACTVWKEELNIASNATKYILGVFKPSFSMGVVAGNYYEVGDRVVELKVV